VARGTSTRVVRLRAPRPFIVRGSKQGKRAAILTFRLPRKALVVFEVHRIAPTCAGIGLFRVRGAEGKNRVRFPGRIRGRLLPPGTYQLRARGFPQLRVRVAILPKGSTKADRRAALRARSTCPSIDPSELLASTASTSETAAGGGTSAGDTPQTGGVAAAEESNPPEKDALGSARESRPPAGGALGAISRGARDAGALGLSLILVGICAAILLLATASLPETATRGPWLTSLVADRRLEIALAGVVTLVVVTLAYLVSVS
jgi:hypothetical protein